MLEILFPRFEISKSSGGACPRIPREISRLRREQPNLQQSDLRLDPPLLYDKKLKANETAEHKEKRLLTKQAYNKKLKSHEIVEHKEKRLLVQQVYDKN